MTTSIEVKHYDRKGNQIGVSFNADLIRFKYINRKCDYINWDDALTAFVNGKAYKTTNMPYGDIEMTLSRGNS
tara:strand:+ start:246 stop:464 length:219 start_codon:yes stop_codon:yes gene_type:complete